ncbi:hypothetical protein HA397_28980, partial [Escherichia coli]|nr:hypothetical protein [Escherichia coli]
MMIDQVTGESDSSLSFTIEYYVLDDTQTRIRKLSDVDFSADPTLTVESDV